MRIKKNENENTQMIKISCLGVNLFFVGAKYVNDYCNAERSY